MRRVTSASGGGVLQMIRYLLEPDIASGKSDAWDDNMYFKTAFHKTCWLGCHKETRAKTWELRRTGKGGKAQLAKLPPTTCNGCHLPEGR